MGECVECGDDGTVTGLAPCTTMGSDCACNGPRVEVPCPECQPNYLCEACGRTVTGPCMEPVDMGGGMVDTPCDLSPRAD